MIEGYVGRPGSGKSYTLTARAVELHGTHAGYNAGCRCGECRGGHAGYARSQRAGARRLVTDVVPVREHLEALWRAGWSTRALADRVGLDRSTLYRQAIGERGAMQRRVADALLAIPAGGRNRTKERSAARIEDAEFLVSVGESALRICERLGVRGDTFGRLLRLHGRADLARWFEGLS